MQLTTKANYVAPKLVELGTFEEMTQASVKGVKADKLGGHKKNSTS
jgi:hypothetical protein